MNFKKNETAQKLRGGYYTDPDIAAFLARWVLEKKPKSILEPSCGDGAFLAALADRPHKVINRIDAYEIISAEAKKAQERASQFHSTTVNVTTGDFLELALSRVMEPPRYDAVIGNPPFIRYQYLGKEMQTFAEQLFRAFDLPFTKHTNAWVSFVLASVAQLHPGGRLAMVVPSEILHVLHARSLRDFLLAECSRVLILDPADIWFEKTLQGVVLLMAERKDVPSTKPAEIAISPIKERNDLANGSASNLFARETYTCGSHMNGKWMLALLSPAEQELLIRLEQNRGISRFFDLADVDVGIVTGANKFFLVPDAIVAEYGLEKWTHPMFGRSEHVPGVVYDTKTHEENRQRGLPTNFIWFGNESLDSLPSAVRKYIRLGESQELHQRYKCRIRSPWYAVPSVYSTEVGMLKRSHNFPRLIWNRANAFTTDTSYRIEPKGIAGADFVVSFVNSLTALSAELEGRHYGGGVLELVPSEIEKVLIPNGTYGRDAVWNLDQLIRSDREAPEILAIQDDVVLHPMGVTKKETQMLLDAWMRLRHRRHRTLEPPRASRET